jgi:hypothetical protein
MNSAELERFSDEAQAVVRKFEDCEFSPEEFRHLDHLTVITCYLEELPVRAALGRMRAALKKFTAHHKAKGYNETITRFWVVKVAQMMAAEVGDLAFAEVLERVRAAFGNKELVFQYYSRERVMSQEAKEKWIEPDLRNL